MKTLILVRHGHREESENHDPDLSKKGVAQVEMALYEIRKIVKDKPFDFFTSPYKRCQQTAAIIGKQFNKVAKSKNAIREHPMEAPPVDPTDTKERLLSDLRDFLSSLKGDTIVVSHLRTIKEIVGIVKGEYPSAMLVPHASVFVLDLE